ncbi:peptide chain release factor PrfB3, chloroplastic isoform X2 [Phalaenopsis equestris]|uniref:peptide chain release factor PrfB3, chloroplastic isoform X2 n=1 Tax=Phalaenopsis equestris TaxID=78828 RepID=UPI0009E229DD|nr:peptide chain release factor PrfB3, chloroplastic isoform X2 [Phalaenopsis equestris]
MAKSPSAGNPTAFRPRMVAPVRVHFSLGSFRAAQSMQRRNAKIFKELGLFSLKKKIEETVNRAEMMAPGAMKFEEERRIKQEEVLRECNLWDDDITSSNESLSAFADSIKAVNNLKDMWHKAEEAKLITQLAEMDIINGRLFEQAYSASLDVNDFLDRYEMSKLLRGPYDKEGACMIIRAGTEGTASEMWTETIQLMYTRWAEKIGHNVTGSETFPSSGGGTKLATIEFEKECMYGYLSGEQGIHRMIHSSLDGSIIRETCSASIDVIPLFLENMADYHIDDKDMEISSSSQEETFCKSRTTVSIRHIPSNTVVQCSGMQVRGANLQTR